MDAAGLTEKLRAELKKLDQQIADYRQERVDHFMNVTVDLVRDVPDETYFEVKNSIASSLQEFPAICPGLRHALSSADELRRLAARVSPSKGKMPARRHSPPPLLHESRHDEEEEGDTSDTAGRSRERDAELHGLFTPPYLPLLEDNARSPPTQQLRPATTAGSEGGATSGTITPTNTSTPSRPGASRRATDEASISSVLSEASTCDTRPRRSALRRSSSTSKTQQSPRRVRFEVGGTEVAPSASPSGGSQVGMGKQPGGTSREEEKDDDSLTAAKILGYDDDEPPTPRRLSSTEKLRAMAKRYPNPDQPWPPLTQEELDRTDANSPGFKRKYAQAATSPPPVPAKPAVFQGTRVKALLGTPPARKPTKEEEDEEDDDDDSEGEFLTMGKLKSFRNKTPIGLPKKEPASKESAPSTSSQPASKPEEPEEASSSKRSPATKGETKDGQSKSAQSDDDDIFSFESENGAAMAPSTPPPVDDEGSDEEDPSNPQAFLHISSSSTARSIPQPEPVSQQAAPMTPTTPLSAKIQPAPVVGSYKGKPIMMPVVVNPDVHAQAASLGQFSTFVGGLDGRSGMDEADLSSFRASISRASGFSGTPRSFSERLMMEEMEELDEKQKNEGNRPGPPT